MTTALAEMSKSDLLEKVERMTSLAKRAKEKHSKEELLWRAVGTLTSSAGGAAAALMQHGANKFFASKYAGKVIWGSLVAQDLLSLAFEGTAARVYDSFTHGQNGFLTGDTLKAHLNSSTSTHK